MLRFQVYALVLVMLLAGCSLLSETQPTPVLSPLPTRAISPLAAPGLSTEADIAVRAAIADLAAKRKVASDKIQVVSAEAVDWPDTSMGCPQPGMFYAQVIVQGFRIVLSIDGQQVTYHTDRQGHVGTCPK